ncbi:hypothetical protein PVAP13_7NG011944 [Panicum virgatum]|uniref:Uncharacterized protein n=1 Tax=Panicum virgatum TaxID=38727 RepID=A0A8T0Q0E0_PANVG|nr:hypothetical protein PVAP13_7NG011944 [Panicum virgatum]
MELPSSLGWWRRRPIFSACCSSALVSLILVTAATVSLLGSVELWLGGFCCHWLKIQRRKLWTGLPGKGRCWGEGWRSLTTDGLVSRIACGLHAVGFFIWARGEDGGSVNWTVATLIVEHQRQDGLSKKKMDFFVISVLHRGPSGKKGATALVTVTF